MPVLFSSTRREARQYEWYSSCRIFTSLYDFLTRPTQKLRLRTHHHLLQSRYAKRVPLLVIAVVAAACWLVFLCLVSASAVDDDKSKFYHVYLKIVAVSLSELIKNSIFQSLPYCKYCIKSKVVCIPPFIFVCAINLWTLWSLHVMTQLNTSNANYSQEECKQLF